MNIYFHIFIAYTIMRFVFSCHDLNTWGLWLSLFNIVRGGGGTDDNAIPDEVSQHHTIYYPG